MPLTVLKKHIPALTIIIAVILIGSFVYPFLPDVIPSHFDIKGNPDAYFEKDFSFVFFIFMLVLFIIILAIDLLFLYPILPGWIMAVTNWSIQGIMAVIYLSVLAFALGFIGNFLIGFFQV